MARHLVIGGGGLGLALHEALGDEAALLTRSTGFDVHLSNVPHADVIWYTVGYGSIKEAKDDEKEARKVFVETPLNLLNKSDAKLICFSSDYAANEDDPSNPRQSAFPPRSVYASLRIEAEEKLKDRASVIRIGSLYGSCTKPSFVTRALERRPNRLPSNLVTPTPVDWLARSLIEAQKSGALAGGVFHAAPEGNVSVKDWGMLLGLDLEDDMWFDEERPRVSSLGNTIGVSKRHWKELWDEQKVRGRDSSVHL